jgi:hypothetical protein
MKSISIAALIIFVTGCTPVKQTYYKPEVNDGYYKTQCGGPSNYGATHLSDKLVYFVYIKTNEGKQISVDEVKFIFRVEPNSTLNFTNNKIALFSSGYNSEILISSVEKREWNKEQLKLEKTNYEFTDHLIGYHETNLPTWTIAVSKIQKWGGFFFDVNIPPFNGSELSLKLPNMVLDGQLIEPEILKINKVTEHHMSFIC